MKPGESDLEPELGLKLGLQPETSSNNSDLANVNYIYMLFYIREIGLNLTYSTLI